MSLGEGRVWLRLVELFRLENSGNAANAMENSLPTDFAGFRLREGDFRWWIGLGLEN